MAHHHMVSAIILGHSMGGKTAMAFACPLPLLTTKLLVAEILPEILSSTSSRIFVNGLMHRYPLLKLEMKAERSHYPNTLANVGIRQFSY